MYLTKPKKPFEDRCKQKVTYADKEAAESAASNILSKKLYPYKCHVCDFYHLTSRGKTSQKTTRKIISKMELIDRLNREEEIEDYFKT